MSTQLIDPGPGNLYDKAASKHPVERRLVSRFAAEIESLFPSGVERVLDVGCGEGTHMGSAQGRLPDAFVAGVDRAPASWLVGHRGPQPVVVGEAIELPFADRSVDLVLALEILEHLPHPERAVVEMARICRSTTIFSVPWEPVWRAGNIARGRYLAQLGNTPGHIQHFTRRSLLRMIQRHFEIDAVRRPLPWTVVRARAR